MSQRSPGFARRLLGAVAAVVTAGLLSACSGSTSGEESTPGSDSLVPVTFQMGWLPTVEWGAHWIADSKGYYKEEGVDFEWLPGGPNVADDTVLAAGKSDISSTSADTVAASIAEGADFKIIGAAFKKSPFSVVSLAESPIETPEDMIGKKIGVAAANQTQFDLFLKLNEIDPSEVEVVPVQFDPSPVANGEVDGQVVYSINEPGQLNVQGIETHTMLFADFGYNILTDVYYTTRQLIEEKPDALAGFLAATKRGFIDMFEDPDLAVSLTTDEYGADQGLDPEQQRLEVIAMRELVMPNGSEDDIIVMTEEEMELTLETLAASGNDISMDELFDTSIQDRM